MSASAPPKVYPPLTGSTRALGTLALALATFMNVLDTSIANVSLPAIAGDLGVSTTQGTWVITSFAVANAIAVPLTGWLTQRVGQVRLFVASVLLFVLSSWLCGMAPNMVLLIAFRALQGFVAGPMIPLSQTMLLASYPRAKAGLAMAIFSIITLVAPITGPLLGGWITDNVSWSWIFFINVPVGLVAAAGVWSIYRKRESETRRVPIDAVGLALLVVWVGSLQIMLDKGKELDWFSSPFIVTMAVVATVGCVVFLIWELTEQHPVVDLKLFARRNFWAGALATSVAYGLFFGNVVILPLWLQQYMGYTATDAGMIMAPVGILAIVLAPVVGLTVNRVDPRVYTSFSFLIFALVFIMRSHFTTDTNLGTLMVPTIIQGIATATFFIPLITITLAGLPPWRIAAASGLSNFTRITAGAFGTSISTTLWENRATMHHAQLAEAVQLGNPQAVQAIGGLQKLGMSHDQALASVNNLVTQQAYMISTQEIFYGSALLFLGLIVLVWLAVGRVASVKGDAGATAGAH
ncbi:MAG: DHA2 family efflux MFS transporter permease subunit [Burkholderiaceae bacterium]|jgi:DHA2 family multidrug resistance protein|nr:DHA2 family efflux MFS transporter permease subunit [Burkholderiaceae bacterium]